MAELTQSEPIFEVDFNNVADGGRLIKASLQRAPQGWQPEVGSRVFLRDSDGDSCWAAVADIRPPMIFFEPDDSTWVSESLELAGIPLVSALA
jgi:hypothetical protein